MKEEKEKAPVEQMGPKNQSQEPEGQFDKAAEAFLSGLPNDQKARFVGASALGGGLFKKLIGKIIADLIASILSGAAAAPQKPLGAVEAYQNEQLARAIDVALTPEQRGVLNGLGINWQKLIAAIIRAVLEAIQTVPTVPESAPR